MENGLKSVSVKEILLRAHQCLEVHPLRGVEAGREERAGRTAGAEDFFMGGICTSHGGEKPNQPRRSATNRGKRSWRISFAATRRIALIPASILVLSTSFLLLVSNCSSGCEADVVRLMDL